MKQILLVDNDPLFTGLICHLLQTQNYKVKTVSDGKQAARALHEAHYDLVIADMFIPFSNGFELLQEVRESGNDIPVVVVSDVTNEQSIANCYRLGASGYFAKPINPVQLLSEIKNLVVVHNNVAA